LSHYQITRQREYEQERSVAQFEASNDKQALAKYREYRAKPELSFDMLSLYRHTEKGSVPIKVDLGP